MQTKLRIWRFVVVASLLWNFPTSAATHRAKVINKAKNLKVRYIGTASWYGKQHQGHTMANGKRFNLNKLTAASWYFPLGTMIRVVNVQNGQSVIVTVTDRGPNFRLHRILDLSESAARHLDYVDSGLAPVFIYPIASFETASVDFDSELTDAGAHSDPVEYQAQSMTDAM